MTVKVGDIVYYNGKAQRIMVLSNKYNYVIFSSNGKVSFPDLSVLDTVNLEIAKPHQFEPGDTCVITPITEDEKQNYGVGWTKEMNKYVGQIVTVTNTRISPVFGPIVYIDKGYEFQTYHLAPVYNYDMI